MKKPSLGGARMDSAEGMVQGAEHIASFIAAATTPSCRGRLRKPNKSQLAAPSYDKWSLMILLILVAQMFFSPNSKPTDLLIFPRPTDQPIVDLFTNWGFCTCLLKEPKGTGSRRSGRSAFAGFSRSDRSTGEAKRGPFVTSVDAMVEGHIYSGTENNTLQW